MRTVSSSAFSSSKLLPGDLNDHRLQPYLITFREDDACAATPFCISVSGIRFTQK
ncbi:hypothetical protein NT01EI_1279 [Edwardsiella ictaluri 93-146]|uniref:Uncharacterized protein n=1 Tax=Edwardsiella ictaluri (strain 93-146) TaxID=634503 RepID=C5BCM1_EDWI9|nr:hypothetical protein NT01EI_1279 [Edwardsiella ictaluri 93-146]